MSLGESLNTTNSLCWLYRIPDYLLSPIKEEVNEIKKNFLDYESRSAADTLAGNIKNEYYLKKCKKALESIVVDQTIAWNNQCNNAYLGLYDTYLAIKKPLKLDNAWVNFQKKYEFNPPHTHSGLFSFVIWLSIPYTIADEKNRLNNVFDNVCGQFSFIVNTPKGIENINMAIDKSYNGVMAIFKADTMHEVFPFYTSDDYRITVSGNLVFNNEDK